MQGWIVGFCYICNVGGQVTESFQEIADRIYDCPWYEMPLKITKSFPTMIAVAQTPIYLYGCLNIRCIRITYRRVSNLFIFLFYHFTVFLLLKNILILDTCS